MATVAKWGSIKFGVTSKKVKTFRNMERSSSASWAPHAIVGARPKMEYQGADMDEIELEIVLDAQYGVKPRTEQAKLRKACKKGSVYYLYIGGKKVCVNKMYIASSTEDWNEIWSKGELVQSTIKITFAEYR